MTGGKPSIVHQYRDEFIAGIAAGERMSDIAARLGITLHRRTIRDALVRDPEYRAAIEAGHEARLDKAERMIEEATTETDPENGRARSADGSLVARARAYWAAVAWRAERECPGRWGPKQEVTVRRGDDFARRLRDADSRVIDAQVIDSTGSGVDSQSSAEQTEGAPGVLGQAGGDSGSAGPTAG